jgi:Tol biopolymer transport system component
VSQRNGSGGILNLRINNSNGQIKIETALHNKRISLAQPDWFPDFRIIVSRGTTRNRESTVDLFVIDTTGTVLQQLTDSGTSNNWAKVSPDGRRIVWKRWDVKNNNDIAIWLMNADGSGLVRLTAGWEPDWASDGRHIIYRKEGDYIPGEPWDDDDPKVHGSLWIIDVETKEQWQFLPI